MVNRYVESNQLRPDARGKAQTICSVSSRDAAVSDLLRHRCFDSLRFAADLAKVRRFV